MVLSMILRRVISLTARAQVIMPRAHYTYAAEARRSRPRAEDTQPLMEPRHAGIDFPDSGLGDDCRRLRPVRGRRELRPCRSTVGRP